MKKNIVSLCFISFCIGCVVLISSGCVPYPPVNPESEPQTYWDGENATYIHVTDNFSAYGYRGKDYSVVFYRPVHFFLDPEGQIEVIGMGSNNTWELKVPAGSKDLYVHPPLVTLLTELGEQLIPLDQEYPIKTDHFSIVSVYIPQLVGEYPYENNILLEINIVSATNQYPDKPELLYDGKSYRISAIHSAQIDDGTMSSLTLKCEMPDLKTASMVAKFGTLKYSRLQTVVPGDKAVYTCDDESITVHIIGE